MKDFRVAALFALTALLSGCSGVSPRTVNIAIGAQERVFESGEAMFTGGSADREYALNVVRDDISAGKYEPAAGCYLGVYAASDKLLERPVDFDVAAGKRHALYEFHIAAGAPVPGGFLEECAAFGKTPLITVVPPAGGGAYIYDASLLIETARQIGGFGAPAFVNLYPYAAAGDFEPILYAQFWNVARSVLNAYAPNAALVWSAAQTAAYEDFDPMGGGFFQPQAHWAGFELFIDLRGGALDMSGFERFKEFYAAMQDERPVMLFVAVSHHFGNNYYTAEAARAIEGVYKAVLRDMPRVKAVVYLDYDERDMTGGKNDYTVTGDDAARDAYRAVIDDARFLTEAAENVNYGGVTTRSPLPAKLMGGEYYAPLRYLERAGVADGGALGGLAVTEGGERYVKLSDVNARRPVDFYISADDYSLTIEPLPE